MVRVVPVAIVVVVAGTNEVYSIVGISASEPCHSHSGTWEMYNHCRHFQHYRMESNFVDFVVVECAERNSGLNLNFDSSSSSS